MNKTKNTNSSTKPKLKVKTLTVRFESEKQLRQFTEAAKHRRQSLNQFMLTAAEELVFYTWRFKGDQ